MNNLNQNKKVFLNIAWPFVIAMFFIIDRILKELALQQGLLISKSIISDLLRFRLLFNKNMAFSLPISGPILILIISLVILLLIYIIFHRFIHLKNNKQEIYILVLILFGAISNLIDRFFYGAVVDYLDLKYFTIFNLADVMISVGVIIYFINYLKKDPPKQDLKNIKK